ncbi:MAG: Crp/Fnr family transcriptional regulator [Actinomycetota bacterium]|nr:Crp/Fnr family transcriptional regulator [Actinomycetota bacterium]
MSHNVAAVLEASGGARPASAREQRVRQGQLLYRPGTPAEHAYVVLEGRMRVFAISEGGREVVFWHAQADDFLGVADLLAGAQRTSFAEAKGDVRLLALSRSTFLQLFGHPTVSAAVCLHLSQRLRRARSAILTIATAPVATRLAHLLVVLSDGSSPRADGSWPLDASYSRQELSEMIGASRQSVSEALGVLRDRGWIELRGRQVTLMPELRSAGRDIDA